MVVLHVGDGLPGRATDQNTMSCESGHTGLQIEQHPHPKHLSPESGAVWPSTGLSSAISMSVCSMLGWPISMVGLAHVRWCDDVSSRSQQGAHSLARLLRLIGSMPSTLPKCHRGHCDRC